MRDTSVRGRCAQEKCDYFAEMNKYKGSLLVARSEIFFLRKQIQTMKLEKIRFSSNGSNYYQRWLEKDKENELLTCQLSDSKKMMKQLQPQLTDILRSVQNIEASLEYENVMKKMNDFHSSRPSCRRNRSAKFYLNKEPLNKPQRNQSSEMDITESTQVDITAKDIADTRTFPGVSHSSVQDSAVKGKNDRIPSSVALDEPTNSEMIVSDFMTQTYESYPDQDYKEKGDEQKQVEDHKAASKQGVATEAIVILEESDDQTQEAFFDESGVQNAVSTTSPQTFVGTVIPECVMPEYPSEASALYCQRTAKDDSKPLVVVCTICQEGFACGATEPDQLAEMPSICKKCTLNVVRTEKAPLQNNSLTNSELSNEMPSSSQSIVPYPLTGLPVLPSECRKFCCSFCNEAFDSTFLLRRHVLTHTEDRPFECDCCHKRFSAASTLRSHYRTHTGERPFSCNICKRGFTQMAALTVHYRLHTGERPYKCEICGKGNKTSYALTRHYASHSDERPYQCDICLKAFKSMEAMKTHRTGHIRQTLKSYKCKLCNKECLSASELNKHFYTHTESQEQFNNIC